MNRLAIASVFVVMVGFVATARAAENPTGTWKWSVTFNDQTREQTIMLKLDGDKLTGDYVGRNDEKTPIADGKFNKDSGEISFTVSRERGGNKIVTKYNGKVKGDEIKGKSEGPDRDGKSQSRDWVAKREKAKA